MLKTRTILIAAIFITVILGDLGVTSANAASEASRLNLHWKNGIGMSTQDKSFKIKLGGRIQSDWVWNNADEEVENKVGQQVDGSEFRRARLYFAGTIYKNIFFKTQFDFVGGDADFNDLYIGIKGLPLLGHIKAGHFKEPFSLANITSSKYITFMEKSITNVFSPGRNSGVSVYNTAFGKRLTWSMGTFRDAGSYGKSKGGGQSSSIRLTGLPYFADNGGGLLHLGASYGLINVNDTIKFSAKPEVHLSNKFADTGNMKADSVSRVGFEAAAVMGPFSIQSEYASALVDSVDNGDPAFSAYYLYTSYFITGEHRRYKKSAAAFGRVAPEKNFDGEGGVGAWEVAVRYSSIDLDSENISGGELTNLSTALNWYLNPNTRLMFDYNFADLDQVGNSQTVMARFQIDF